MSHVCFRWILVAVFLAFVGCSHGTSTSPQPHEPPRICQPVEIAEQVDPKEACPSWYRVARKSDPDAACPDPGEMGPENARWQVSHLFDSDSTHDAWTAGYAESLPQALRPFCLYRYDKNEEDVLTALNKALDALVGSALRRADFGCAALAPARSDAGSEDELAPEWQKLAADFLRHVGKVDRAPEGDATQRRSAGVELAFLDTQPAGKKEEGNSAHGFTLAELARQLVCTEKGNCSAEITHQLALPIKRFSRGDPESTEFDRVRGGYSGSVDNLARAVWKILEKDRPDGEKLVLNLSVAWDGKMFGGLEDDVLDMPVTVQALHEALSLASCRGALTVAAAGNKAWAFSDDRGPLLPAAWEERSAPDAEQCRRLESMEIRSRTHHRKPRRPKRHHPEPAREPLIYAAGGVRFDNSPLYNSRLVATPPRVAYADQAVAIRNGTATERMTGTSVACAVVSATAAAVWHQHPTLSRSQVMDVLYDSGEPLGQSADLYFEGPQDAPEVKRISLCWALQRACETQGGHCQYNCPDKFPDSGPCPVPWSDKKQCEQVVVVDAGKIKEPLEPIAYCGDRQVYYDPARGLPADPCPGRQFFDATALPWQPSSYPAPEDNACSDCSFEPPDPIGTIVEQSECRRDEKASHVLRIRIDDDWQGGALTQAMLEIGETSLVLGLGEMQARDCAFIENVDGIYFKSDSQIVLRFLTEDKRSVNIPLL